MIGNCLHTENAVWLNWDRRGTGPWHQYTGDSLTKRNYNILHASMYQSLCNNSTVPLSDNHAFV